MTINPDPNATKVIDNSKPVTRPDPSMSRFRRVITTHDTLRCDGLMKAPKGSTGYEVATSLLFGFSSVCFDKDSVGVLLDGSGLPNQDVLALYLKDYKD